MHMMYVCGVCVCVSEFMIVYVCVRCICEWWSVWCAVFMLCTLSHARQAKATETKGHRRGAGGTPGRTSNPWQCTLSQPATQKRRRPRDTGGTPDKRHGVHRTPWQCTLSHACHANAAETKGHRRDAGQTPRRTSDPLAVHIVTCLPRKRGGDQGTPEGRRRDARAYIRPLGNAHCPTPAAQKRRRPRDTGGTPEGRQGVHPTPWQCTLSHPARKRGGDQGTPEGRRREARAYIRPLGSAHGPTPATQKRRRPRDTGGTPEGRQGVYIRPLGSAHCPTPATQKRRRPRDTGGSEWVWVSEWVSECRGREWVSQWVSEWVTEWVSESVSEWVSEWVSQCMCEWVSEWEDGRRRGKADTELKTKTPHVNVGKNKTDWPTFNVFSLVETTALHKISGSNTKIPWIKAQYELSLATKFGSSLGV